MFNEITDLRRLFRNRFEVYLDSDYAAAADQLDGSRLTLFECGSLIIDDKEPFPVRYRKDLEKLRVRARLGKRIDEHTYGDVASLLVDVLLKGNDRSGAEHA